MTVPRPRLLMCPPDHFCVSYSINPWMDPDAWAPSADELALSAQAEWRALRATFEGVGAEVITVPPQPGLPDMVFTANSAVVFDGVAVPARFRYPERQGEEPPFERFFAGLVSGGELRRVAPLPDSLYQEGAGDCIWDRHRQLFWAGYGPRSDEGATAALAEAFGQPVVPLALATAQFYHLDTAFCPLTGGEILYYPAAFTDEAQAAIERHAGDPGGLIPASKADAEQLAVNAVVVGRDIVMAAASTSLRAALEAHGYRVHVSPLDTFRRSGGGAFCLSLRLDTGPGAR